MTGSDPRKLISEYLEQIEMELQDLSPADRAEIVGDLRAHILEATGDPENAAEADVRNVLDRLGHPVDVANEARSRSGEPAGTVSPSPAGTEPNRTPGALEVAAIILTAVLWPIGILLAWLSQRWKKRDKVIATVVLCSTSLVLLLVAVGGFGLYEFTQVTVNQTSGTDEVGQPADPPPGTSAPAEPRSPADFSGTSYGSGVLTRALVVVSFLLGVVGGPFFTAIYLAIRLQPVPDSRTEPRMDSSTGVPAGGRL